MKRFISFALGLSLLAAVLVFLQGTPIQAEISPHTYEQASSVITVCLSGACDHTSIQDAVDAADTGDTIKVAASTYTDLQARPRKDVTITGVVTQVVYISKTVTIQGGYTITNWTKPNPEANVTTLDAKGEGRVLYITGDISPTVKGLHITGGNAGDLGGGPHYAPHVGGGIYIITATACIRDNHVSSNSANNGAGLFVSKSSAAIQDNVVVSNTADEWGGGIYLHESPAVVHNNIYSNNAAEDGAGVNVEYGAPAITANQVVSNTATCEGGGIYLFESATSLRNNVVADNQAGCAGSGLFNEGASPRLAHNTIARNGGGDGSGLYITAFAPAWKPTPTHSDVMMTNTLMVNHSVGISITGGNTVTVNDVLWHNTPVTVSASPTAVVSVRNQHAGEPAFAADGYHLTSSSAAIDQGVDTGVETDIDGDPRDADPDLGADEYVHQVYLPLTMNNYEKTLTLGILGPFSGPSSQTGDEFKDAVNMAFDEADWHAAGYKIEPVWIDSQSTPVTATQAYEGAITQDGVQAGLLNWHSSVAVACMDVVAEHEVPHFAGFGATGVVNGVFNGDREKYGYWTTKWWPTPSKLSVSYVQMLEKAIDSGHWSPSEKTVAIYGENTDWGHAFGDGIKANFEDAGWSVVAEEYFPYGQTDFTALMKTLNGLNPAVVAGTTTSGDSAAAFINQADAAGLNSVIIADGLGWSENWYEDTGNSSNYVVDQIPVWADEESQAFKQAFEDRYGYSPSPSSGGLAYDGAKFFINVAQATYEQHGALSSETLYSFTQNQVWTGQWTYTDGVMMEEYKYTEQTIPDPMIGEGHYMFPVLQYFDGEGKVIFPPDWAEQPFTPPGE